MAVGCPFCMTMLRDGVNETGREEKLRVMDVAEIVAAGLVQLGSPAAAAPVAGAETDRAS